MAVSRGRLPVSRRGIDVSLGRAQGAARPVVSTLPIPREQPAPDPEHALPDLRKRLDSLGERRLDPQETAAYREHDVLCGELPTAPLGLGVLPGEQGLLTMQEPALPPGSGLERGSFR